MNSNVTTKNKQSKKQEFLLLIKKRIADLFGRPSESNLDVGSYYYDECYKSIYRIVNERGAVAQVMYTGNISQTLDLLNNINMYACYIKNR